MINAGIQIELEPFIEKLLGFKEDDLLRIKAAYDSPGRYYHTFRHASLFCAQAIYSHCLEPFEYFPEILVAALYHDAVLAPGVPDNEKNSADLMRQHMTGRKRHRHFEVDMIAHFIMLTAKHFQHRQGSLTDDEAAFLDCDLYGFAHPWDAFLVQNERIDKEYLEMGSPKSFLDEKRGDFLRNLLARPHIYNSTRCIQEHDRQAVKNVERLLREKYS